MRGDNPTQEALVALRDDAALKATKVSLPHYESPELL